MQYFTLSELLHSDAAYRLHIANQPTAADVRNLNLLVAAILDPARRLIGSPIYVTSGYRSKTLNRAIGGSSTSQHTRGQAADITCSDNALLFRLVYYNLPFDQLIWEKGTTTSPAWVHVSYNPNLTTQRHQSLRTLDGHTYLPYSPTK